MQNQKEKEENFFEKYSNYLDVLKNINFPLIQLRKSKSELNTPTNKTQQKLFKNVNSQNVNKRMSYIL